MAWQEFTKDFDYEKIHYDVLLESGDIINECWPNAGKMCATDGSGRKWDYQDRIKVRPSFEDIEEDCECNESIEELTEMPADKAEDCINNIISKKSSKNASSKDTQAA